MDMFPYNKKCLEDNGELEKVNYNIKIPEEFCGLPVYKCKTCNKYLNIQKDREKEMTENEKLAIFNSAKRHLPREKITYENLSFDKTKDAIKKLEKIK